MARYEFDGIPATRPVPVAAEDVPTDMFGCGRCGAPLPLAGVIDVAHDCATGEVVPADFSRGTMNG